MENNTPLVLQRTVNAPSSVVWRALTDITILRKWMPFFTDFAPQVGFVTQFMLGRVKDREYLHTCEVTEVVEGQKLTYSWRYEALPGDSYVTFELTPMGQKTHITLTHRITQPFPADNPDFAPQNFTEGWTLILDNLKKYIKEQS